MKIYVELENQSIGLHLTNCGIELVRKFMTTLGGVMSIPLIFTLGRKLREDGTWLDKRTGQELPRSAYALYWFCPTCGQAGEAFAKYTTGRGFYIPQSVLSSHSCMESVMANGY